MSTQTNDVVDKFERFYQTQYQQEISTLANRFPRDQKSLEINWQDLFKYDSELAEDYLDHPEQMRDYAEEALRIHDIPNGVNLADAHVRIANINNTAEIRELRSDHVNQLISIEGIVRNKTDVRPKLLEAAFECQRCGTLTRIPQSSTDLAEPHECQGCDRQGPFNINYTQSDFIDSQALRLQESPEGLQGGETPQNLDVRFRDDIVGDVSPGNPVEVTGIVRLEDQTGQDKSTTFDMYIEGVSLRIKDEKFEDFDLTEEDKQKIEDRSELPDVYEAFRDSIAPSIYGYPEEKLAIMLQLFSGYTKHLPDNSRIRGDIHILLIGDPGTGKSQLLQYIRNVAPRSVYASGKGSSTAGLCVTGDTRIHTTNGFIPIRDLATEKHPEPVSHDTSAPANTSLYTYDTDNDSTVETTASHVWRMPEKPCIAIEAHNGTEITVSENTPLLTKTPSGTAWKEASNLIAGDIVRQEKTVHSETTTNEEPESPEVNDVEWVTINSVTDAGEQEVFDLTVPDTHNFVGNGFVTHNTAAAVQVDMGDGSEWTLEAGTLVLADKGIAAIDELDKMSPEDRSALHEGLEQQEITVSKAGINATLKSRCALLGAANPKYGRFDEYETVADQIELDPALISRFDLIFTITDDPNEEEDRDLARHILDSNVAGELNTKKNNGQDTSVNQSDVDEHIDTVDPEIDPMFFRKYIAYAKQTCFPELTKEARNHLEDFYVDLRDQGSDEDAAIPVTARKLEALVRLAEASARVRLSNEATIEDAKRATTLAHSSLEDIGIDPETGEFDADMIETGSSTSQRERVKSIKGIISELEDNYDDGAPEEEIMKLAKGSGMDESKIEHEIENLKQSTDIYCPANGVYRTI